MENHHRTLLLEGQSRAYITGTVEYMNNQWVFFDDESDEATMLDFFTSHEIEVYYHGHWKRGILQENGELKFQAESFSLRENDSVRIRKNLTLSLEMLLDELNDDAFLQFITTLNSLQFSIYDCIFCHNHLSFLEERKVRQGVNFITFDNGDEICGVQHHFSYYQKQRDRFEFTKSTGKRIIIERFE
ncbi:DUF2777 domain-containing protein [Bacillus spongiae]|uniref:DUF2777 domain-containing protein n=1 Tax=Bacillus spongiae TaxID=2683610 RepID=A0ABU8HB83_9BACI